VRKFWQIHALHQSVVGENDAAQLSKGNSSVHAAIGSPFSRPADVIELHLRASHEP
jgi:hypothetical protein